MNIIDQVKNFVEEECKKPTSKYGYDPFTYHFIPVVEYIKELAKEYDADIEILEIAAWLHDIGSIIVGRKDHHITSGNIAEKKLRKFGYPEDKIKRVKDCIFTHRGSQGIKPETIEAQILVEADTMSAFSDLTGLYQCAFAYEKLPRKEAKESIIEKLENKWNQLQFEKSKELIRPKYEAAMLLLK